MTPIESIYDSRLVVLLNTVASLSESLALSEYRDPSLVLAEYLCKETKKVLQKGEELPLNGIKKAYPLLFDSLD
jgi:hypothetical protein